MPTFCVLGRGQFPADMLRHDRCYPADTSSALAILRDTKDHREVYLRTASLRDVTPGRWSSFGWTVLSRPGIATCPTDYVEYAAGQLEQEG
jgi:hypothetical protein